MSVEWAARRSINCWIYRQCSLFDLMQDYRRNKVYFNVLLWSSGRRKGVSASVCPLSASAAVAWLPVGRKISALLSRGQLRPIAGRHLHRVILHLARHPPPPSSSSLPSSMAKAWRRTSKIPSFPPTGFSVKRHIKSGKRLVLSVHAVGH